MEKAEVIRILERMANILELSQANPFEVLAYRNGAQNLQEWEGDLKDAVQHGTLREIPGIGKGLSSVISELVRDGASREYDRLRRLFPETLLDLLSLPGIGPGTIRTLYQQLGIDSVDRLEDAARKGEIQSLKGFGAKSEARILRRIERARQQGKL